MEQPRQQHYHFAYTALPSKLFAGRVPSMLLSVYPDGVMDLLHRLWEVLGEQFPAEERAPVAGLRLTAHRLGGKHMALLVHMPPPERSLETYFVAIVFTPELRYFTLGRGMSFPGMPDEFERTTFREVAHSINANLGSGPEPTADAFLRHLCARFELSATVEAVPDEEVRRLAAVVPASGPSIFDEPPAGDAVQTKRWWQFWK